MLFSPVCEDNEVKLFLLKLAKNSIIFFFCTNKASSKVNLINVMVGKISIIIFKIAFAKVFIYFLLF